MSLLNVIVLAVVQGLAELLPVSSSAHVVVGGEAHGPGSVLAPDDLAVVMLHTGTMVSVIVYFWKRWRTASFGSVAAFKRSASLIVLATAMTGFVGLVLLKVIERVWFHGTPHAEVEQLFSHLELIAPALALVGILILVAGILARGSALSGNTQSSGLDLKRAGLIGAVQGLCLPFRGFSRSGATISASMLVGVAKGPAEDFSFALAVVRRPHSSRDCPGGAETRQGRTCEWWSWSGSSAHAQLAGSRLRVPGRLNQAAPRQLGG